MTEAPRHIDIYLSRFLAGRSGLDGLERTRFAEFVEQLSAALEGGHSCFRLEEDDRVLLTRSRIVSEGGDTPLILQGNRLYLHRYYRYESTLATNLLALAGERYRPAGLDTMLERYFGPEEDGPDFQKEAARLALESSLCFISGGPGTGKTTTVVRILALLLELFGKELKIGLAAPTGKAAMRLMESVSGSVAHLPRECTVAQRIPQETSTLHRLLGVVRHSSRFRHNRQNPMLWDVLVIDEASMVDVALMSKVVDAMKPGARLILLGDKDQLASVESGAVLSDCIGGLPDNTAVLEKSFRFDTGIARLAGAINKGDSGLCRELLLSENPANVGLLRSNPVESAGVRYRSYMDEVRRCKASGIEQLFQAFGKFQVLCATRYGSRGVGGINMGVESYLKRHGYPCVPGDWYPGRPVMIMQNDYSLGLFNGDIGICLADPDGTLKVWFEPAGGTFRQFPPYRLPASMTVFAMTVHKSQGSEFGEVLVVLPDKESRVLNRQLVYTAVTRAREKVRIAVRESVLDDALSRSYTRSSGLKEMLLA